MSLFKNIMSKIFGVDKSTQSSMPPDSSPASPSRDPDNRLAPSTLQGPPAPAPVAQVDVGAVLEGMAAKNSEKLDWKKSIVDLMKLLDLDSSLSARKELATELNYSGDPNDSATMNVWLHKQVLKKLSENGGNVPADLLD